MWKQCIRLKHLDILLNLFGQNNSTGVQEAQNLELARDWEGAAEAYQKAGMYAEAGRVRQMHLENNDPQVKIDIAQLGDKIQDSVVMKDGQSQNDEHQV